MLQIAARAWNEMVKTSGLCEISQLAAPYLCLKGWKVVSLLWQRWRIGSSTWAGQSQYWTRAHLFKTAKVLIWIHISVWPLESAVLYMFYIIYESFATLVTKQCLYVELHQCSKLQQNHTRRRQLPCVLATSPDAVVQTLRTKRLR